MCPVCICKRAKLNYDIVPLRLAEDNLMRETKMHREEAKIFLNGVESAQKVMNKNI